MTTIASRNDVDAMKRILFLAVLGHKMSSQKLKATELIANSMAREHWSDHESSRSGVCTQSGMEQRRRGWPTDAKHRSKSRWMAKFIDSVCLRGAIAREPLNPSRYRSTEELVDRTIIVELYNCIQFRCYLGGGCWIYYVIHDVHGPYSCWMTTTTTKMDRRRGVQSVL